MGFEWDENTSVRVKDNRTKNTGDRRGVKALYPRAIPNKNYEDGKAQVSQVHRICRSYSY